MLTDLEPEVRNRVYCTLYPEDYHTDDMSEEEDDDKEENENDGEEEEKNVEEEEEGDTSFQWTLLHLFLHCVKCATGNVFKSFIQNYIKAL